MARVPRVSYVWGYERDLLRIEDGPMQQRLSRITSKLASLWSATRKRDPTSASQVALLGRLRFPTSK
jgi:hypothetical protein